MNLVQLSEQLKDVPDNFLMTEVQNPTGAYPAYLIVSEMTRRKRMRENAPKQEPQTTVAEDLMSGGIRAMQPQMPQQMPQQPGAAQAMASQMPMPQMPQSPQEPQMMAAGGLVAFEQGGPIRAQTGLFVDPTQTVSEPGSPLRFKVRDYYKSGIYNEIDELEKAGFTDAQISQMDPAQRTQTVQSIRQESMGVPSGAELEKRMAPAMAQPTPQPLVQPRGAGGGASKIPPPPAGPSTAAEAMRLATEITTASPPTYDRAAEIIKLGAALPDTASQAMADYIGKQEGQMAGQRESNLNMALMQAGLGMMGSRARSGIQGVAEGGLEGLKSYRQGMSDIQKGEQQIELARMKMAEAKDARQRGLYDLAMKDEALGIDAFKLGQAAKAQGADILAKLGQTEAYEKVGQLRGSGRTADTIPSPAEVKSVREQVTQELTTRLINSGKKFTPNSPEFMNAVEQEVANQFATRYGKRYLPSIVEASASQRGDFNALTAGP
jgi:hypothetical protein